MKKIMFNDKFLLTQAVLNGTKTVTRRVIKKEIPIGNWQEAEKMLRYKVGEVVAIAQRYSEVGSASFERWEEETDWFNKGFSNKMFVRAEYMPYHIRITDVKIERLQDITDEDCLKEGVWQFYDDKNLFYVSKNIGYAPDVAFLSAREAFWYLIDSISGKGTWESNPWMGVYTFEKVD